MTKEVWEYRHRHHGVIRGIPVGETRHRLHIQLVSDQLIQYGPKGRRWRKAGEVIRPGKKYITSSRPQIEAEDPEAHGGDAPR